MTNNSESLHARGIEIIGISMILVCMSAPVIFKDRLQEIQKHHRQEQRATPSKKVNSKHSIKVDTALCDTSQAEPCRR